MKKTNIKTRIIASVLGTISAFSVAGACITSASAAEIDPQTAITQAVSKLNYRNEKVMARKGETVKGIDGVQQREIIRNADNTITFVTKTKKSLNNGTSSFAVTNAATAECYPGALLLGNPSLSEGDPQLLKAPRNDINLSIHGIGVQPGTDSGKMVNPTKSSDVTNAINELKANWDGKDVPAEMDMSITQASSDMQVAAALGIEAGAVKKLKVDYEQAYKSSKKNYVMNFKQVYYSVSADMPDKAGKLFSSDADTNYILSKFNNENPPVMVSNVDYGRMIMINIVSSDSENKIKAALKAAAAKNGVQLSAEYKSVLNNATFKYMVYGGSSEKAGSLVSTKDYQQLLEVINSESKYTDQTCAAPISYTARFLKDGRIATSNISTDYVETTSVTRKSIPLRIFGTGINGRMDCGKVKVEGQKIVGFNKDGSRKTEKVVIADVKLENSCTATKVPFIPADIDLSTVTVSFDYEGKNKSGFTADANCFNISSTKNGENIDRVDIEIEGTSRGLVFGYYVEGYVWINKNVSSNTGGRHSTSGSYAPDFYIHDK